MLFATMFAVGAAVSLASAGYVFGARRGVGARHALRAALASRESELALLERSRAAESTAPSEASTATEVAARAQPEVDAARARLETMMSRLSQQESAQVNALREELRQMQRAVSDRDRSQEALTRDIQRSLDALAKQSPNADKIARELSRVVSPLIARDDDARGLRETVKNVLGPMLERDRLGRALAELSPSGDGLAQLPSVLAAIAKSGGFSSVVLIDDVGLALGASGDERELDRLAGEASMLLTLADRASSQSSPAPLAMVLRDVTDRVVLHRIFEVGGVRFVLAAVARTMNLLPNTLDPALTKLEDVLVRREIAA
jgi:hypothetical protein